MPIILPIEDWDGEPSVRLPDDVMQQLDLHIGDSLYLVEAWCGDEARLVLSKTPQIPDQIDVLVAHWEREPADSPLPHAAASRRSAGFRSTRTGCSPPCRPTHDALMC